MSGTQDAGRNLLSAESTPDTPQCIQQRWRFPPSPSVIASTFSSKPSPTWQQAGGTDLPQSPLLLAVPGPHCHIWAPRQDQRGPSPSQDSCVTGQGSGLGARLRNVGCLLHTHHLPQLLLRHFIFFSPCSLCKPSSPLSPGGWTSSLNSLALISMATC